MSTCILMLKILNLFFEEIRTKGEEKLSQYVHFRLAIKTRLTAPKTPLNTQNVFQKDVDFGCRGK